MKWNDYFMNLAQAVSMKSKDTTKVGCVIVGEDNQILSTGYNGFARGVSESFRNRMQRPEKYSWTIHAEANAIAHAARHGVRLKDSTIYVTHKPCMSCADMIIQSGVNMVVYGEGETVGKTEFNFEISDTKFYEAQVKTEKYECTIA